MKKASRAMVSGIIPLLFLATASAQWQDYPVGEIPRTATGEIDWHAPAPRTAWGTPDFSGVWELYPRSAPGRGAAQANMDIPAAANTPPAATFFDLGANMEGGLPYQDWARALRDQRVADGMKDNPDAHCLPMGHTQFQMHPQPRKMVQVPELLVIIYEANYGLRQVFMDGRSLPDDDPLPWWYGYSIGYWQGDTLVVETTGLRDGGWLDVNGSPFTDKVKFTERFTRVDYGHMIVDITVDDPTAYTQPFTVRVEHGLMPESDLIEFICNENEQSSQYFDP